MGFRPDDTYTAELQTVLRTAHALKDTAGASHSLSLSRLSPTAASLHAIIDSITLPSPCPLLPALLKAGFCHENATEINQTYRLRAEELRQRIQETLITTCRGIAELPVVALGPSPDLLIRKVVFTLTELYLHRIEQWKEEIIQRIKQAPKTPTKVNSRNSRAFNQVSGRSVCNTYSHLLCSDAFHFWSTFSNKIRFRRKQIRYSSPRNQIWNTGKFMYG